MGFGNPNKHCLEIMNVSIVLILINNLIWLYQVATTNQLKYGESIMKTNGNAHKLYFNIIEKYSALSSVVIPQW